MAWNNPGGRNNPWGRRPGQGGPDLDERLNRWQRKLALLLRPGRGERRPVQLIVAALALGLWVCSGVYQVGSAERGVVLRFGALAGIRQPGLHFHIPWPVESVEKVNVWAANSSTYQARVLTSDIKLVELHFAVQYQLTDPIKVLFHVRDPERTLAEVSESVIREVVGRSTLEDVLVGTTRPQITRDAQTQIQRTLDEYDAGITIRTVNLTDVQVPDAVLDAQRDANKALAEKDQTIKAAQAEASGIGPQAEGSAAAIAQQAQAYSAQVHAAADAQSANFNRLLEIYNQAPAVTRRRLYLETMESVLSQAHKVVIDTPHGTGAGGNVIYLPLDKLLEKGSAVTLPPEPPAHKEPEANVTVEAPHSRGER